MTRSVRRWIGLALAHVLLCGCVTRVHVAPRSFDWTTRYGEAVWRRPGVEVAAARNSEDLGFPVRAIVRVEQAGGSVSFEPPADAGPEPIGRVVVDGEARPIVAGSWYPVPPGANAGTEFSLRPDSAWTDPPAVDSTVSCVVVIHTDAATERCPFLFRVESTSRVPGPDARTVIVIALIPVFLIGLAILLVAGIQANTEWHTTSFQTPDLHFGPAPGF